VKSDKHLKIIMALFLFGCVYSDAAEPVGLLRAVGQSTTGDCGMALALGKTRDLRKLDYTKNDIFWKTIGDDFAVMNINGKLTKLKLSKKEIVEKISVKDEFGTVDSPVRWKEEYSAGKTRVLLDYKKVKGLYEGNELDGTLLLRIGEESKEYHVHGASGC
jgi:hypothetical protein